MNSALAYFYRNFLAAPKLQALPDRVREQIRQRDHANETLLRCIQLFIILLFCFIYAISPKTHPPGAIVPVPLVLGAYLTLSVISLVWVLRREPPEWTVYLSILFDFALLYGLMLSFHIQYMQPASFVLKAPALLYVFIFIAIRALRFDAKYVLAAGVVAIIGWAFVIYYVTRIDPGDNMLTRSYIEYLTSNSILIGAEVDKILSIAFVTFILALAVNGSNNLLVTAITEQSAAADLSRFFDTSVAQDIRANRLKLEAGQGEMRQATIMFIDIRGFTRMAASMDASRVMQFLSAYQGRVIETVRRHGGIIDKFMGDGVMATFGTANGGEGNPAAQALAAAAELLEQAPRWPREEPVIGQQGALNIGIGIATGNVAFGAVGSGDRLEMTVIGAPVNLAAKLEKHNKALGSNCLCDSATWRAANQAAASQALHCESLSGNLDGVAGETDFVRLSLAPPVAIAVSGRPAVTREPE